MTAIYKQHPKFGISLGFYNCDELSNLQHLRNLTGVLAGGLVIYDNAKLRNVDGLAGLQGIAGKTSQNVSLWVGYNSALENVWGLNGLQGTPPGLLSAHDNPKLPTLAGLEGVPSWGGGIKVRLPSPDDSSGGGLVHCTTTDCLFSPELFMYGAAVASASKGDAASTNGAVAVGFGQTGIIGWITCWCGSLAASIWLSTAVTGLVGGC